MNLDFGKPFNGILARLNITFMVLVWAAWGYVILAYDRPVLKTVGMASRTPADIPVQPKVYNGSLVNT